MRVYSLLEQGLSPPEGLDAEQRAAWLRDAAFLSQLLETPRRSLDYHNAKILITSHYNPHAASALPLVRNGQCDIALFQETAVIDLSACVRDLDMLSIAACADLMKQPPSAGMCPPK